MAVVAKTATLYRPVGLMEWELIEKSGRLSFPPRLEWQPIFYPVLTLEYAVKIARDWNTRDPKSGYVGLVTEFDVDASYLSRFSEHTVGGSECRELWVPAEQLGEFNRHIRGPIRLVSVFRGSRARQPP
ncbi:MAG: hypothetical protein AB1758_11945 [Candidatus Eremiobacterota bacterium]